MSVTSSRGDLTRSKRIHWNDREECEEARCQREGREFKVKGRLSQCDEVRADGHDNESKQRDRRYSKVVQKGNTGHRLQNPTERDQTEKW